PGAGADGYAGAAEFTADLRVLRDSVSAGEGERVARLLLDPLLRQVETFGFHLHTLDARQHARVHVRAVEELARGALIGDGETEGRGDGETGRRGEGEAEGKGEGTAEAGKLFSPSPRPPLSPSPPLPVPPSTPLPRAPSQ